MTHLGCVRPPLGISNLWCERFRQDYFDDGSGKTPRYDQANAINAATEAIAKGQDRVLLVMATGTDKT